MGLRYAFQLAFHRARAADVLHATAAFAEPVGECRVTLPDGERLVLPFAADRASEEVVLEQGVWTTFDTSLWLPVDEDEAWQDYLGAGFGERFREGDGGRECAVGYVCLTVGVGERYALFTFSAVTSGMSRLFSESQAVHRKFGHLLETNGGLRGLLDLEWGTYFPLLATPGAYVLLNEEVINEAGPDAWVEAALAAPVQTD